MSFLADDTIAVVTDAVWMGRHMTPWLIRRNDGTNSELLDPHGNIAAAGSLPLLSSVEDQDPLE